MRHRGHVGPLGPRAAGGLRYRTRVLLRPRGDGLEREGLLARLGVIRLFDANPAPPELPQRQRAQIDAYNSSTRQVAATAEEFRATPQSTAQARSLRSLGDKPSAVVSAGEQSPAWLELQDELATLSSNNRHRVVEGATHVSLLYDRSDAPATSAAIVEVVEAARNDQPPTRQAQARGKE